MTREEIVQMRLMKAKRARHDVQTTWETCKDYYDGKHRTALEIADSCRKEGIPWITAMSPDPYIHVESQITGDVPDFSFKGREACDEENAKSREAMVRYVLETSGYADLAAASDRRAVIGGTAVWKVFWDGEEVRVADIDPSCIFPDPAAKRIEDCEYLLYCYPMQRSLFARLYRDALSGTDLDPDTMPADPFAVFPDGGYPDDADTLVLTEHWYKTDDGEIALAVYAGGKYIRGTDRYWENTRFACYPFVFRYWLSDADSIWGRGDLEPILTLVDAVDRELASGQLASAFSGNDVILAEHDAFSIPPSNRPGAIWELKPGAMGKVARLGGRQDGAQRLAMIESLRGLIQEAVGNFDVDMGRTPANIMSASGLAQLIERSELRKATKKAERLGAFRRLLGLIDRTALEFYDRRREFFIGAGTTNAHMACCDPSLLRGRDGYFPAVDTIISTSDGMRTSRAFLVSAIDTLMGHTIDGVNYPLAGKALELAGLDDAGRIAEHFKNLFGEEVTTDHDAYDASCGGDPQRLQRTGADA